MTVIDHIITNSPNDMILVRRINGIGDAESNMETADRFSPTNDGVGKHGSIVAIWVNIAIVWYLETKGVRHQLHITFQF